MKNSRPSGNGNALRDYRITQVEEAVIELRNHTRKLEDNFLEMRAQSRTSGMGTKWQLMVLAAILTTISGLTYALLTLPK